MLHFKNTVIKLTATFAITKIVFIFQNLMQKSCITLSTAMNIIKGVHTNQCSSKVITNNTHTGHNRKRNNEVRYICGQVEELRAVLWSMQETFEAIQSTIELKVSLKYTY